jgi:hypothetical protein
MVIGGGLPNIPRQVCDNLPNLKSGGRLGRSLLTKQAAFLFVFGPYKG